MIEHGRLIETWQSFINPETIVPSFIQKLTGIKPTMLNNAPNLHCGHIARKA